MITRRLRSASTARKPASASPTAEDASASSRGTTAERSGRTRRTISPDHTQVATVRGSAGGGAAPPGGGGGPSGRGPDKGADAVDRRGRDVRSGELLRRPREPG